MSDGDGKPKKVAILGGGAAGLTAAFALTEGDRRRKYEVTVYQMGWRLGGKGASGRNASRDDRTEEHGIHVWFGFYENAFRLMRACYDELSSNEKSQATPRPVRSCFGDAFVPHEYFVLNEKLPKGKLTEEQWVQWPMYVVTNGMLPGDGAPLPAPECPLFKRLQDLLAALGNHEEVYWRQESARRPPEMKPAGKEEEEFARLIRQQAESLESSRLKEGEPLRATDYVNQALDLVGLPDEALPMPPAPAEALERAGAAMPPAADRRLRWRVHFFAYALRGARLVLHYLAENTAPTGYFHRCYLTVDTFAAIVRGIDKDIFGQRKTLEDLDDYDLRAWLLRNGADERFIMDNPSVRFVYNSAFAFEEGDHNRPSIAAGAALRGILRVFMTYKGALAYRMTGGMGDIVFGPLYEVLAQRGVKFEFFHRVEKLELEPRAGERPAVARVRMSRQVRLKDAKGNYRPLVNVNGLPSWPDRPDYDQIAGGEALKKEVEGGLNLEDPTRRGHGEEAHDLVRERDFDQVVLAIPVEALRSICADFERDGDMGPRWREMFHGVKTTPTQAFQLWFRGSLADLGWDGPPPVFGTYVDPIDTYIDMTHALPRERQDPGHVKSLAYFCGVIDEKPGETWKEAQDRAKKNAIEHLTKRGSHIFPRLELNGQIDWSLLTDGSFDAQYWRANVLPSERYTLALPGCIKARLAPHESGCSNLFLAGDWTKNPLNLGCVEAAVMSGLACARALTDEPIEILGDRDDFIWQGIGLSASPVPLPGDEAPTSHSAEKRRIAPSVPFDELVRRIEDATVSFDRELTYAHCKDLIYELERTGGQLPDPAAKRVLNALRRKRHFDLMENVADTLIQSGHEAAFIRRHHAQALIDSGRNSAALAVLRELGADPKCGDAERAEVLGLIGRIHKQRFVNTFVATGRVLEEALRDAIRAYGDVYRKNRETYLWHGINLVALSMRAKHHRVAVAEPFKATDEARWILTTIEAKLPRSRDAWDCATAAEACLAINDYAGAFSWINDYVRKPGADLFELTSTARQLTEVWQLNLQEEPGESLLSTLFAYIANAEGGRSDMNVGDLRKAPARIEKHLQRVHGQDVGQTIAWYQTGLTRSRLVARILGLPDRLGVGTGFLVRAGDFLPGFEDPDEMLVLTNAHVMSKDGIEPRSLRPEQAVIRLETLDPGGRPAPDYRVDRVLWSSPSTELDASLVRLVPRLRGIDPYPIAPALPNPKQRQRVYIIGYHEGDALFFSLQDNLLVAVEEPLLEYRTPTMPGSSGSPVFNDRWELIGMHHAGDVRVGRLGGVRYGANEGVWIGAILGAIGRVCN